MWTRTITVVSLAVLAVGGLLAADRKNEKAGWEMNPAMEEALKRGAPGEHHRALDPFAGRFKTTSRIWMNPGQPPQEAAGSVENTWVLGGRFLRMDVRGDMGGRQYEGIGYLGYDNVRGEYTAVWLDNMNTGITRATGQFDSATKTYMESGIYSCPMTGQKNVRFRGEWKIVDDKTLSYTMYNPGPDGKEVKGMEVSYERVK